MLQKIKEGLDKMDMVPQAHFDNYRASCHYDSQSSTDPQPVSFFLV